MRAQPSTALPPHHRFARALLCAALLLAPFGGAWAEGPMYGHIDSSEVPPPPGAAVSRTGRIQAAPPTGKEAAKPVGAAPQKAAPKSAAKTDSRTIGLLLPLTGPSAALGKSLLDAATLALYDMQRNKPLDRAVPIIRLAPKDTQGTAEGALAAFRELMKDEHPTAILGPLFSAELEPLLPLRDDANVPMFAFTNNNRLAGRGSYQLGFMAQEQARALADYAKAQKVQRVAGVASADSYGRQLLDRLTKELKERGIDYGPTLLLPPQGTIDEATLAPLIDALKERRTVRQFLFVGAQGAQLNELALRLDKAHALQPKLAFIGGGAWDDAQQLRAPALTGAVFVSPPREGFLKFTTNFQSTYNAKPPRIAGLAYDGVALITSLIYGGAPDPLSQETLHDAMGFKTPTGGLLRFNGDGTPERKLAVFIANGMGNARVVQNAGGSF